ncbi:CRAL/TRIO domain-containing protein, partial [Ramicandelaber brevisporus]
QCLLRYLRASKWNLAKAKQMLSDTLRWRLDYKPHLIAPPDVEKECLTGKIYLNGFDMAGRPIVYMKPVRENSNSQEGNVRNVVYQLEQAIRVMPTGVEKICLVIDFTNNPISKSVSLGTAKQIVDILSKHYVERLGVSFIYNAPWYFTAFYSTVSPWLDPVTKAKIRFIDQKKQIKALKAYEEADVLETSVGGKFDFDYKHEVYWARVSEL